MANEKAKAFLKQYGKIERVLANKIVEKQRWEDIAQSVTAPPDGERVQSSGKPDKMAGAVARIVDIEREIDEVTAQLNQTRKDILCVIEQLPTVEYDALHKCYIQGMTNGEIADLAGKEYSWASRNKFRGECKVQQMLEAREAYEADLR